MSHHGDTEARRPVGRWLVWAALGMIGVMILLVAGTIVLHPGGYHGWQYERLMARRVASDFPTRLDKFEEKLWGENYDRRLTHLQGLVDAGELDVLRFRLHHVRPHTVLYTLSVKELRDGHRDNRLFDFALSETELRLWCEPEYSVEWRQIVTDVDNTPIELSPNTPESE
jgi:hypothetical protein